MKNLTLWLFACSIIMISCSKDKTETTPGSAGLVAFNLAPDQDQVMVTVDGNYLNNVPLAYSNYSGKYIGVYEGERSVVSFDKATNMDLAQTDFTFKDSTYYSLFFLGYNNNYRNYIVEDKFSSLPKSTGKSFVRYLYGIPDSLGAHITISDGTTAIFDENNSYSHISSFSQIAAGSINVSVKNGSGDIDAQRSLDLDPDGIYTVIFHGTSQSADTLLNVRISLIKNGIAK